MTSTVMTIIWAVALVVLIIIEAATAQLVTIWFAAGALVSLIAAILHAPVSVQIILFIIISLIALIATRPLVRKLTSKKNEPMNTDRIIGKTAIITESIDNLSGKGAAKIEGAVWSARSEDGSAVPEGSKVTILRIEGVKIIVKNQEE